MSPAVTVHVVAVGPGAVQVAPPGLAVTVYPVMAAPPLLVGTVQVTVACGVAPLATPPTFPAATPVGAPGTVAGTAGAEAADTAPVPAALVAVTVNVYAVPAVSPEVTVHEVPAVVQVAPPGDAVTV